MKENTIVRNFAVKHTFGDEERIIRLFTLSQKEEAKVFAQGVSKEYGTGIIAVISASFMEGTVQRADRQMRPFEVYPCRGYRPR